MDPHVRAVQRDVDRNISDDLHAVLFGICPDAVPLFKKFILAEFPEIPLLFQQPRPELNLFCIAQTDLLRPTEPFMALKGILQRHI